MSVVALVALGACQAAAPSTGPTTAVAAARSTVGPGSQPATAQDAINNFAVCINSAPTFAQAPQQLRALPFTQNSNTGTWYHQTLNLSINVSGNRCSMVFGSNEERELLGLALAVGSTEGNGQGNANIGVDPNTGATQTNSRGGTQFLFTPAGTADGTAYFRAAMTR
ncbi:hypothetical protein L0664_00770 [Octadecabacter sp. G9-8]|uniref:Lipoprotein n=1 Tax=Octadecabacter dasysiphoniae TaxID=2909341 RepID=A0ABS9CU68_9RHOB|nr:hypothetical protein [Octadecabacter dasysiphoniae]MCF2869583.1 hypothetical protein [Octadecabacter dasysiphoniae]